MRGFVRNFKVWLEGIEVNADGFVVTSTPNGNDMSISFYATKELWDLKPKTHVVVGYQDPIDRNWYLLYAGEFSGYGDSEQATQGRSLSLTCRDFRMSIRKTPAALAWDPIRNPLKVKKYYNAMGVYQNYCVKGVHPIGQAGTEISTYNNSGLLDLSTTIRSIAQTATGAGLKNNKNGEYIYTRKYGSILQPGDNSPSPSTMLDAIIRGLWLQSVSGTSAMAFLNKRLRVEKNILTPINKAGYDFWKRQDAGTTMSRYLMGNSQFSSLEAAIMRLAAVFSVRPYACSTPSLISVSKDSKSSKWVMDPLVREFLVERQSAEFGAPYVLGTSLLLPNLEFTAPPNFNIMTPSFYDNKYTERDIDKDVTRANFTQTHLLSNKGGNELGALSIQFPNSLFNNNKMGVAKDENKRRVPPMTIEERYKGVNCFYSKIAQRMVMDDAKSAIQTDYTSDEARRAIEEEILEITDEIKSLNNSQEVDDNTLKASGLTQDQVDSLKEQLKNRKKEKLSRKDKINNTNEGNSSNASKRHSLIKFMNEKFKGRVSTCDMSFNPFVCCGFPGLIVGDYNTPDQTAAESLIGMVQQVKHTVWIKPEGADASTSIVMSNSRLTNEPTSVDDTGNPLYMRVTRGKDAEINKNTLEYDNDGYTIPPAKAPEKISSEDNLIYDTVVEESVENYPFVKDLLTLTIEDIKKGERNKTYLDKEYEPNRIAKFYTEVFGQKEDHFMIGNFTDKDEKKFYMYDTIHEGVFNLSKKKDTLNDYAKSFNLIKRNVCSIDEYFIHILGCSVKIVDKKGRFKEYKVEEPDKRKARPKYYGVTTDWYKDNKGKYTRMSGAGMFSSISERMPVTAFIQERVDSVNAYISSLAGVASSER